ncbi:hypothetical protein RhiirC2_791439 [Rhizophagus irregularis]|uniref:Uncharacterized protein n=1 Tax=Rhizophagus irregularis TaxID=588596 RepID=A0A2N1MJ80_9GLOM|nr:hypothetical protein RhiirC2_791439 [Rhizophagus irregularis]
MDNKSVNEHLFNINKFLSVNPPPNIYTVQNYASAIDISNIFSITFNAPFETLPPLARIDTAAEKILHLQYPNCLLNSLSLIFTGNQTSALQFRLAMVIELMKHADFYLITYNKEKEYISEILYMSKSHQFCSIIGIYGLASVIQRPIMSIYPPTISQLISTLYHKLIKPRIKAYNEHITIMWTSSNGKWNINDPLPQTNHLVPIFKLNSSFPFVKSKKNECECKLDVKMQDLQLNNEDSTEKCDEKYKSNNLSDDDGNVLSDDDNDILPSISFDKSDNKKKPKNQVHAKQKTITKLDQIKNKNLQRHPIVNKIITCNKVQCKCGKIIKLHQAYNSQNLEIHSKTVRLREKKHVKYLQRIGVVIYYGGTPRIEILLGKDWKRLTSKETAQLENELAARAKWRNDFSAGCKCMELNSDKNLKASQEDDIDYLELLLYNTTGIE